MKDKVESWQIQAKHANKLKLLEFKKRRECISGWGSPVGGLRYTIKMKGFLLNTATQLLLLIIIITIHPSPHYPLTPFYQKVEQRSN